MIYSTLVYYICTTCFQTLSFVLGWQAVVFTQMCNWCSPERMSWAPIHVKCYEKHTIKANIRRINV